MSVILFSKVPNKDFEIIVLKFSHIGECMSFQTAIQLLGGVGIFLFAIKLLSDSLQALADNKLRSLIASLTKTPLLGVLAGTFATMLLQSSSATTVMTISFVDAGLMTLKQAVGVIMGANIGTTVTGQIVAFNVKDFAYVFVIVGVILNLLSKSQIKKDLGIGILAFGLLFIGMQTMENAMYFLRERKDIFLMFADKPLLGLVAGALLTLLVQSSSATMGIAIALSLQGLLPLAAAMPIILGVNVGTTITAMLAAIGTSRQAQQTSTAHVLFNMIAVFIFYPLMPLYIPLIEETANSVAHQIANAHTFLNIANTIFFLPFVTPFTKLIRKILPDEKEVERIQASKLDPLLIQTSPINAVEALYDECNHMAKITLKQFNALEEILFNDSKEKIEYIRSSEKKLNAIYNDINNFASLLTQSTLPEEMNDSIYDILSYASDLERIGDKSSELIIFYQERKSSELEMPSSLLKVLHDMFIDSRQVYKLSYYILSKEYDENDEEGNSEVSMRQEIASLTKKLKTKSFKALIMPELRDNNLDKKLEHSFTESVRILERIANRASRWVELN